MKLDIEEIIEIARNEYAASSAAAAEEEADEEDVITKLKDLVVGQAIRSAFDAYFAMHFSDFSLDSPKPEVLSFHYDSHLNGGQVVIGDIDTGSFEDEIVLYRTINEAESWVNRNIEEIKSLMEKQNLDMLVDENNVDSPGL